MKQTAVEWLEDNLIFESWAEEHFKHNKECWNKAKEMEKEQIVNAFEHVDFNLDDGLHYYEQTFKSE
jgi:hypothetical protein